MRYVNWPWVLEQQKGELQKRHQPIAYKIPVIQAGK